MTVNALVSLTCQDRIGLVAALTAHLFDLGGNLGDTAFAVLGGAAEFSSVVEFPDGTEPQEVEADLRAIPELAEAEITVSALATKPTRGKTARITHQIMVGGGDRPGLVARLCEAFGDFGANIVRLDAERIPGRAGVQYTVRIALHVPAKNAASCLATVANTAGSLGLTCHWEEV